LLNIERPKLLEHGGLEGQILYVDHFGNVVSNISSGDLGTVRGPIERLNVHVGPLRVGHLHSTFADVDPGQVVAIIGSTGMIEIAINQGNAAAHLHAAPGTIIVVR